jgi:D-alanyl-D-alanine carboxypeptidase.
MLDSRDINRLRPDVAANCRIFLDLCKAEGLNVLITGTVRDAAYQEYCYEKGWSQTKVPSFHAEHAGLAFDICKNVKNHEYDDAAFFVRCGAIGKAVGFEWGGDWRDFPDRPHFQWSAGGRYKASMIRAKNYPPQMALYKIEEEEPELTKKEAEELFEQLLEQRYPTYKDMDDVPDWAQPSIRRMMDKGVLKGDATGCLNLSADLMRTLVVVDRILEGADE